MARLPARARAVEIDGGVGEIARARADDAGTAPLDPATFAPDARDPIETIVDALERTVVYRLLQPRRPSTREPDGGARLVYMSRNIERIFGIRPDDVMADAGLWYGLIEPGMAAGVLAEQYRAFTDGERFEMDVPFIITRGDERGRRIFRINSTRETLDDGSFVWNGCITDITRSAEQSRLTEVAEVSPDLVGTIDAEGRVVYLNRAGHDMLGLEWSGDPDADIAAIGVETLHPPDMQDFYWNEIVPAVKREGVWTGDTQIIDRHGATIPVSQVVVAHRAPSVDPDRPGPITHLSTIVRDMSTRAELEERLRDARLASERARDAAEMARAHAENMTHEVNHRVKNLFALVPAIVQLSARATDDVSTLVRQVRERVAALVRSHELTLNENGELTGVSLTDLLEAVLEPYCGGRGAVRLDGPEVRMNAADGNALSLVLHELATNAAKHGALLAETGRIDVGWNVSPRTAVDDGDTRWRELALGWRETSFGAPALPVAAPTRTGSGTLLLDRLVGAQNGTIERTWHADGLEVAIALPIHGARPSQRHPRQRD